MRDKNVGWNKDDERLDRKPWDEGREHELLLYCWQFVTVFESKRDLINMYVCILYMCVWCACECFLSFLTKMSHYQM